MDIGEGEALFPTLMRRIRCFKERKNRRLAPTDPIGDRVARRPDALLTVLRARSAKMSVIAATFPETILVFMLPPCFESLGILFLQTWPRGSRWKASLERTDPPHFIG